MKIEVTFLNAPDENVRRSRIQKAVSEMVYDYLKETGLMNEPPDTSANVKNLLDNTRRLTRKRGNIEDNEL